MKIMFDSILRKLKALYPLIIPDFQNIMILFNCKIDLPRKCTLPIILVCQTFSINIIFSIAVGCWQHAQKYQC